MINSLIVVTVVLMVSGCSGNEDGDIHMNHRCCQHDMWHGWLHMTEGAVFNGTDVRVHQNNIFMDSDYTSKMQKLNISSWDVMNQTLVNIVVWKDFGNMMGYTWVDGNCYAYQSMEVMQSPCIDGDFVYGGSLVVGSGEDAINAHNWRVTLNGAQISLTVTEGDCTPVTMSMIGEEFGTQFVRGYLFSDVHQGFLSAPGVFDLPKECREAEVFTPDMVGK